MLYSNESHIYNSKELEVELKFCYTQLGEANKRNPFAPSKSIVMQRINFYRQGLATIQHLEGLTA